MVVHNSFSYLIRTRTRVRLNCSYSKKEAHIESSTISIVAFVYSCFYGEGMIMNVSKKGGNNVPIAKKRPT